MYVPSYIYFMYLVNDSAAYIANVLSVTDVESGRPTAVDLCITVCYNVPNQPCNYHVTSYRFESYIL